MEKSKLCMMNNMNYNSQDEEAEHSTKWSKDWKEFDWESVKEKLAIAENKLAKNEGTKEELDIGITLDEFTEYLRWFAEDSPEEYDRLLLYIALKQKGVEDEQIDYWMAHLEELEQLLEMIQVD